MNQDKIERFKAILKKWNPLGTAENNITEVNKYMSFYSEKILKEYYGISY